MVVSWFATFKVKSPSTTIKLAVAEVLLPLQPNSVISTFKVYSPDSVKVTTGSAFVSSSKVAEALLADVTDHFIVFSASGVLNHSYLT